MNEASAAAPPVAVTSAHREQMRVRIGLASVLAMTAMLYGFATNQRLRRGLIRDSVVAVLAIGAILAFGPLRGFIADIALLRTVASVAVVGWNIHLLARDFRKLCPAGGRLTARYESDRLKLIGPKIGLALEYADFDRVDVRFGAVFLTGGPGGSVELIPRELCPPLMQAQLRRDLAATHASV